MCTTLEVTFEFGKCGLDACRQGSSSEQEAEVGPGRVSLLDPSMTAKLAHLYSLNRVCLLMM